MSDDMKKTTDLVDEMMRIMETNGTLERVLDDKAAIEELTQALREGRVFSSSTSQSDLRAYFVKTPGAVREI